MLRIMIAAPASDSGKTSVTCALLALLKKKGFSPCAFKCGPDYIDPMFHRAVLGVESHNIDLYMCGKDRAKEMFLRYTGGHDAVVTEGVMGYYDGVTGSDLKASAYDVARTMDIPSLLVIRPKGTALTAAAVIKGMAGFREPSGIKGVILNDCPEALFEKFRGAYEKETGLPVLGYIPHVEGAGFTSRHLGLYTAGEIDDLKERIEKLSSAMEEGIDLERLISIYDDGEGTQAVDVKPGLLDESPECGEPGSKPLIAVARDEAFNFIYEETLDTLRDDGADIVEFSPLHDEKLPEGISGLYIPGGYPELHAEVLAANSKMKKAVRDAIADGMPLIAECGGFLYLGSSLADPDGNMHEMAGVFGGEAEGKGRLVRFGYARLTSDKDSLLIKKGEELPVHEFHYWDSTENGKDLRAVKEGSDRTWDLGFTSDSMYAGFPHLYLAGRPEAAGRFVDAARRYGGRG